MDSDCMARELTQLENVAARGILDRGQSPHILYSEAAFPR